VTDGRTDVLPIAITRVSLLTPVINSSHKKCFFSSSIVECMFSTMGLILHGKRSRLSGDKANAISFIHNNFAFLDLLC